jgi:hypothetical protein
VWCVGVEVWGGSCPMTFSLARNGLVAACFPTGRALLAELSIGTSSARSSYR